MSKLKKLYLYIKGCLIHFLEDAFIVLIFFLSLYFFRGVGHGVKYVYRQLKAPTVTQPAVREPKVKEQVPGKHKRMRSLKDFGKVS